MTLVYPDTDHLPAGVSTLLYGSEGGALSAAYDREALMDAMADKSDLVSSMDEVVGQHVSLLLRLNALHIREAVGMGGT